MLDRKALANYNENLKKQSTTDKPYFTMKMQDIEANGSVTVRLLPPHKNLAPSFALPVTQYFMQTDKWRGATCPSTFGRPSPIDDVVQEIMEDEDDQLMKKVESKRFSKGQTFQFACLVLEDVVLKKRVVSSYTVREGKPCIFSVSSSVLNQFIDCILDPQYDDEELEDGMFSIKGGTNFTISKKVTPKKGGGTKTEYRVAAYANPSDISVKETGPKLDIREIVERSIYTDKYLTGLANHYFYNEELPDDEDRYPARDSGDGEKKKKTRKLASTRSEKTEGKTKKSSRGTKTKERRQSTSLTDLMSQAGGKSQGDEEE